MASQHFFLAEPAKTLEFVERGIRMSPGDPQMSTFLLFRLGVLPDAKGRRGHRWLRQAAAASPESPNILAALASELALTGHDAEARAMLARYLALERTRSRTIAKWQHMPDDNPAFRAFDARFKSGLRSARMPER